MKKKDLLDAMSDMDDNADLVLSKALVFDEKEEMWGVIDLPIIAIATNTEEGENEIRFVVDFGDAKHMFPPDQITLSLEEVDEASPPKVKRILCHDDPPCKEKLENGFCNKCGYVPDMQSTCFRAYCRDCDIELILDQSNLRCPKCKKKHVSY